MQVGIQSAVFNQSFNVTPWTPATVSYTSNGVALVNVSSVANTNVLGSNTVNTTIRSYNWCQPGGQSATVQGFMVNNTNFGSGARQLGITQSNWQTCVNNYSPTCSEPFGACTTPPGGSPYDQFAAWRSVTPALLAPVASGSNCSWLWNGNFVASYGTYWSTYVACDYKSGVLGVNLLMNAGLMNLTYGYGKVQRTGYVSQTWTPGALSAVASNTGGSGICNFQVKVAGVLNGTYSVAFTEANYPPPAPPYYPPRAPLSSPPPSSPPPPPAPLSCYKTTIAASANVSVGAVTVFNTTVNGRRLLQSGLSLFTRVFFGPSYYSTTADNYRQLIVNNPSQALAYGGFYTSWGPATVTASAQTEGFMIAPSPPPAPIPSPPPPRGTPKLFGYLCCCCCRRGRKSGATDDEENENGRASGESTALAHARSKASVLDSAISAARSGNLKASMALGAAKEVAGLLDKARLQSGHAKQSALRSDSAPISLEEAYAIAEASKRAEVQSRPGSPERRQIPDRRASISRLATSSVDTRSASTARMLSRLSQSPDALAALIRGKSVPR
ncbi:hypothetical protein WJX73_003288 [Symbiochloris irregularis]|uniref:Uncharacterized protein n=1 Tax=Symbiochloris irregularis TaxID=706552 RepID=A0AAW1PB97_9CHLO